VSDIAVCPDCLYTSIVADFSRGVPGQVKELVHSQQYSDTFHAHPPEEFSARSRLALINILDAKGLNPRELAITCLRGSWVSRELGCLEVEAALLERADHYFDDALRRGLTKGDPGLIMYMLGEVNRRRGEFLRGREMLTFLGNNPRYRYPALLETVLIEEEDTTPYWTFHAPDQMEQHSPKFKGLFPALRSIPPKKTDYSPEELKEQTSTSDEDDRRIF
jgi:hypothetical protein